MSIVRRDQFTGSNNIAKPERLPEGAVVDAVNMDFTVGGKAELRTGFTKIRDGVDVRAIFNADDNLIVVEGDKVIRIAGGVESHIANVSQGPVAAVFVNNKLYLNTMAESMAISTIVEKWGADTPAFDVRLIAGGLKAGVYKVAVTEVVSGVESGCWPTSISVADGQSIVVMSAGGINMRLYSSVTNGKTLYYQGIASSYNEISSPVDDTSRLETEMLTSLPFCENLTSYNGMIVGSNGRFVLHTKPMHYHLHNPESDYLQFPTKITLISAVRDGVYVCADKTYFISNFGSPEMIQRTVAEFGAVAGTAVKLPNGSVAWFSHYGQVIGNLDGSIELINKSVYSPSITASGAASLLEHNGNQTIVTTMSGSQKDSCLKSNDYWNIEVI